MVENMINVEGIVDNWLMYIDHCLYCYHLKIIGHKISHNIGNNVLNKSNNNNYNNYHLDVQNKNKDMDTNAYKMIEILVCKQNMHKNPIKNLL